MSKRDQKHRMLSLQSLLTSSVTESRPIKMEFIDVICLKFYFWEKEDCSPGEGRVGGALVCGTTQIQLHDRSMQARGSPSRAAQSLSAQFKVEA